MTTDLQVISVVDDLQVTRLEDIIGAVPRTLRVTASGGGMRFAQRVFINDFGVDTFIIVSDTVLLVTPGPTFDDVPVTQMSVVVVSNQVTGKRRVRLFFGPTLQVERVEGIQKLIQGVVKVLLTSVGSNRFLLGQGGNLLKLVGSNLDPGSQSKIATMLSQAISSTEEQVLNAQARESGLPSDERLLTLSLGNVVFFEETLEVQASVRLTTFAGSSALVPLVL